jgi:CRISPR/Cas system endoribonuclease Cas6 (RAMP superfamily)
VNGNDKKELESIDAAMMFLSTFSSMFTGFIMSLIRIREPYFRFLIT